MKLRLKQGSLRLRVGPSEVQKLAGGGRLSERVVFGPEPQHALVYSVAAAMLKEPRVVFDDGEIRVELPPDRIAAWAKSENISIEATQPVGRGELLTILVEKDLACRHGEASETDVYPNPNE